jgi:hypothetical protein
MVATQAPPSLVSRKRKQKITNYAAALGSAPHFRRIPPAGKLLSRRRVPEDEHRASGGRNRTESIARHRNSGR